MEKNPINKKIKDFTSYLKDIGLLSSINAPEFLTKFKNISESNIISSGEEETDFNIALIYLKDNISKTMVEICNEMSNERKKITSINIYSKYLEKKEVNLKKRSIILFKLSNKLTKKYFFNFWRNNKPEKQRDTNIRYKYLYQIEKFYFSIKNPKNNNISFRRKNQNIENLFLQTNNFKDINIKNAKNPKNLQNLKNSSYILKDKNSARITNNSTKNKYAIKNNTFYNTSSNKYDVFERLYKPKTPNNSKFIDSNTFNNFNSSNYNENNQTVTQNNNPSKNNKSIKSFQQRLKASSQRKHNDMQQLTELMEEDFKLRFPFKPNINKSKNINGNKKKRSNSEDKKNIKNNKSVYERLYNENKKLQQKKADRIREQDEEFKKANKPMIKNNSFNYNKSKKYNNKYTVIFDDCNSNRNNKNTSKNVLTKQNVANKIDEVLFKNVLNKKKETCAEDSKNLTGRSISKKADESDLFSSIHFVSNKDNNIDKYTETEIICQQIIDETDKNKNRENKKDKENKEEKDKTFSEKEILINKLFMENQKYKKQKSICSNNLDQDKEIINDEKEKEAIENKDL